MSEFPLAGVAPDSDNFGGGIIPLESLPPPWPPDVLVGGPENPYLLRWWLIERNPAFGVYYHRMLRDDEDRALHDHPWPSFSLCTTGTLIEVRPDGERTIRRGDCVYRGPGFAHRLKLLRDPDGRPIPAETLFIVGPRVREWGFHCPKGWIPWQKFHDPGQPAYPGDIYGKAVGCGEE